MLGFEKNDKEKLDEKIKNELEKIRELSKEDLEKIYGGMGGGGDTREEFSMNPEDINRSIYGELY